VRILLVEDDYILGSSLKRALEKHAYGLDWFRDAETALDALRDSQFGCVILDVNLPKASGFDVARSLRRGGNDVPILMLTALDSVRDRVAGLDEGADDYLVKPFDLDELLARLRALIRRRQGHGGPPKWRTASHPRQGVPSPAAPHGAERTLRHEERYRICALRHGCFG
jgi:DNA-binding response OmpR family regulator